MINTWGMKERDTRDTALLHPDFWFARAPRAGWFTIGNKRDEDIETLRAASNKAELALAQAENDLLRQRVLDLETALARQESAAKSAQTKAISEIARLKEKNTELQSQLRQMWDWYNNEIANGGGLTFKASSLIAKALHPDATPSEEVRLEAFKAFSAWKGDRDAARRR
ncbi:hypothetical protein IVA95_29995 [Bradyrhizobium sp. 157]|uniref:hypothetical protein n=1 Tax=Bradyrhizobium sp. 157 TaxID=2782631 RepID=UPI001FF84EF1|nr:hypothetical protein [Bradyrhizobium sp. 157]MCK1641662.1 hypothetical protein [Bradyrhizobium sp. 157]